MSKNKTIPQIEELKLTDLTLDTAYSGRTDKEIKTNARELSPVMEAHGFWDAGQPGQYFEDAGHNKVLCAGFTRYEAAKSLGFKIGYFTKTDEPKVTLLLKCVTTNQGKPVSPWKQGERFAQLRDGEDAEKAEVGAEVLAPMTVKEIAAAVGKTEQHIRNCIAIFETTPEIAELIVEDKVSANVVTRVQQLAKTPAKQLQIVKAAIHAAKEEGKDTATMKHLDAVKAQFEEPTKLKAKTTPPVVPPVPPENKPPPEKPEDNPTPQGNQPDLIPPTPPPQSLADLGGEKPVVQKKQADKYRRDVVAAIDGWDAAQNGVLDDDQTQSLADAIVKIALPF